MEQINIQKLGKYTHYFICIYFNLDSFESF